MPIPQNKKELLADIESSYSKLTEKLKTISPKLVNNLMLDGHAKATKMSVHNLVSYLIGWGELVLKWHKKKNKGETVDFPETGYKWNELGKLAQKFYKDYEKLEYLALLDKLDRTVKGLEELVKSYDNKQLYETPWYEGWTMGRLIQLNSSSPYKNARARLRKL